MVLAACLGAVVSGIPLFGGMYLLAQPLNHPDPGPANWPDISGVFTLAGGLMAVAWAVPLLLFTTAVALRQWWGTVGLAAACALQGGLLALLLTRPAVTASPLSWAYAVLLFAVAGCAIAAALRLHRN